jgi:hypothetical protein
MKIAFHCNHLGIAGTEVAVFDYAFYNQELLNNESLIISKLNPAQDVPGIITKFKNHFNVIQYKDFSEVEKILDDNKVDVFHALKSGNNDGIISYGRKSVIQCVFGEAYEPHGNVYAYISEWLSKQMNFGIHPWVPHMINLPEESGDYRELFHISKDAIVFGRYGSYQTFDLSFVHETIKSVLDKRKNAYFLFANTQPFFIHPQIIYLESLTDVRQKVRFINTCDAMLHARKRGETFGIACGEFSIKNKPVITYGSSIERCHLDILKDKAIIYYNDTDLNNILNTFEPSGRNWDAYSKEYTPEKVMQKFKTVFL